MPLQAVQELCAGCLKRETCEYIPSEGKLLRCLDRQTAQAPKSVRASYADGATESYRQEAAALD